ncbi:MAG TPA: zinc ABC transporter substrate-binding protein, partial [Stellaceae bacterium]|nr:zinc ABC transporter substrate-binding protein [Stellaceae bacterium]
MLMLSALVSPAFSAPEVVVSIKPIHSLIAGVMAGVGEPALIVEGGASPHTYALRPSDAARLQRAALIFWVGPIFEGFLVKPLQSLGQQAVVVELDRVPAIRLLPARSGGTFERDEDEPEGSSPLQQDGHLWLDPLNARAIVREAVARLRAIDPDHGEIYAANGARLEARLDRLDAMLRTELQPVRGLPFVVFHDAYQYAERRYGLAAIGSITVSPEQVPGARRLHEIHAKILALKAG